MRYLIQAVAEVESEETANAVKEIIQDFVENGPFAENIIFSTGTVDLIEDGSKKDQKLEALKLVTELHAFVEGLTG